MGQLPCLAPATAACHRLVPLSSMHPKTMSATGDDPKGDGSREGA